MEKPHWSKYFATEDCARRAGWLESEGKATGVFQSQPPSTPAFLGGHSYGDAPDLRNEARRRADRLRESLRAELENRRGHSVSLDPNRLDGAAAFYLARIEGGAYGSGQEVGAEARYLRNPNDVTWQELVESWRKLGETMLAAAPPTQHQAERHQEEERRALDELQQKQSAAFFEHARTLARSHGGGRW